MSRVALLLLPIKCKPCWQISDRESPLPFVLGKSESAGRQIDADSPQPLGCIHDIPERAWAADWQRLAAQTDAKRTRLERRLGELTREIERRVIATGLWRSRSVRTAINMLNEERKGIVAELNQVPAAATLVAAVLARFEEQLNQLQAGLAKA